MILANFDILQSDPGWQGTAKPRTIRGVLAALARQTAPVTKPIRKTDHRIGRGALRSRYHHAEITDDGMVRHQVFKSLVFLSCKLGEDRQERAQHVEYWPFNEFAGKLRR